MEALASLGSVVIGEAEEVLRGAKPRVLGYRGAAGLQPGWVGTGLAPGRGVIDNIDNCTQHDSPSVFHDAPEKVSFSLSHTPYFTSDPPGNPRRLRELKGLSP